MSILSDMLQCINLLQMALHQHNVFLTIDNVSYTKEAIEQARVYLKAGFREGSLVIVAARSKEVLKRVGVAVENCVKLPKLDTSEARSLFLHQVPGVPDEINGEDEAFIMRCVNFCRFEKGDEGSFGYLPLALKLFGIHSSALGYDPKRWVEESLDTFYKIMGSISETNLRIETRLPLMEVESWAEDEQPLPGDSGSSYIQGEGEPVEVDRFETPRISSEVEELQARKSLNSSDEIRDDHGGQSKLEAELHVIDMVYADISLDFRATRFEVIKECLIASVQGVEAQVAEFSRLHSGNHIQVFNHECVFLVDTLSGTIHDRLRRYNNTLSLVQVARVSDPRRIFMSVAFCIVALTELERMFKAVVDLLTMCSKEDWWNTALELSNTLPSRTIPRWSSFSLAIRSCEWSMDIVDFGFHALQQFLAGASTVTGVVFKWSDKQSRMVLHVDGKPSYHDEGGSSLLDVTRDLEGKDVTALIQKLVELDETPRKWFSKAVDNMHTIANLLSQKLHGPRPEPNSVPYTFRTNLSTLTYVRHLGSGSYGSVAEFKWLGHNVSVKVVKSPGLSRKQFEMEAAILATVQHPRVVRMIGCAFEENKETGSLVMELMEGDLRHVIEKRCRNKARGVSPFPLRVAIDIMLQIGEGMHYLHEHRIMHRDLKALNVLLNRCRTSECGAYGKFPALASVLHTEEYYIVKRADFGIAKARRDQTNFVTMMAGTTYWRAPEVYKFSGADNYEWRADVYSFAMTCYEILTGCIPFDGVCNEEFYNRIVDGERPPLDDVRLPPLLKDLVERCWDRIRTNDPNSMRSARLFGSARLKTSCRRFNFKWVLQKQRVWRSRRMVSSAVPRRDPIRRILAASMDTAGEETPIAGMAVRVARWRWRYYAVSNCWWLGRHLDAKLVKKVLSRAISRSVATVLASKLFPRIGTTGDMITRKREMPTVYCACQS